MKTNQSLKSLEGKGDELTLTVLVEGPIERTEEKIEGWHNMVLNGEPEHALFALSYLFADAEDLPYPREAVFTMKQVNEYRAEF